MAKRYTDSEKWKDSWFKKLPIEIKTLWLFMLDTCSSIGIWQNQFDEFKLYTGYDCSASDIVTYMSDRVIIHGEDSFFIHKFISYQYDVLYENHPIHAKYIKELRDKMLDDYVDIEQSKDLKRVRLSKKIKLKIFLKNSYKCEYCSNAYPQECLTVDYVHPLHDGGKIVESNMICCCVSCLAHKASLGLKEFFRKASISLSPNERVNKLLSTLDNSLSRVDKELNNGLSRVDKKLNRVDSSLSRVDNFLSTLQEEEEEEDKYKVEEKEKEKEGPRIEYDQGFHASTSHASEKRPHVFYLKERFDSSQAPR